MDKITPLFNRVIVKEINEKMDCGSIVVPFSGYRDRGIVVESGSSLFKVGDKIIFNIRYSRDINVNGETFVSVNEEDVLAIIEE